MIGVGFIVALLCVAFLATLSVWHVWEIIGMTGDQLVKNGVMQKMEAIYSHLTDAEIAIYGYRASRENAYLNSYQESMDIADAMIRDVNSFGIQNAEQRSGLINFSNLCIQKMDHMKEEMNWLSHSSTEPLGWQGKPDTMVGIRAALTEISTGYHLYNVERIAQMKIHAKAAAFLILGTGLFACTLLWLTREVLRKEQRLWKSRYNALKNRMPSEPVQQNDNSMSSWKNESTENLPQYSAALPGVAAKRTGFESVSNLDQHLMKQRSAEKIGKLINQAVI